MMPKSRLTVRMDYNPDGTTTTSYLTEEGATPPYFVEISVKLPKKQQRRLKLYYGTANGHPYGQITAPANAKDGACIGCVIFALKESFSLITALLQEKT